MARDVRTGGSKGAPVDGTLAGDGVVERNGVDADDAAFDSRLFLEGLASAAGALGCNEVLKSGARSEAAVLEAAPGELTLEAWLKLPFYAADDGVFVELDSDGCDSDGSDSD